jgi:acylphosphatase
MSERDRPVTLRACRLWVSGRVQGVYFRAHTASRAAELGIVGYARNLPDGRVEVLAGGSPAAIDAFLPWVRRGPPQAVVTDVTVQEESVEALAGYRDFARC